MVEVHRYSPIVWSLTLKAAKAFIPGGKKFAIKDFQHVFRQLLPKIRLAEDLLSRYELMPKVKLGKLALADIPQISEYLYKNAIHPVLFASCLHLIASHASQLLPKVAHIQLRNLCKEHLGQLIASGRIKLEDLNPFVYAHMEATSEDKFKLLERMGVIVFLPQPEVAPPSAPEPQPPRPPITEVAPNLRGLPLFDPSFRRSGGS